jgi:hypothetical protein
LSEERKERWMSKHKKSIESEEKPHEDEKSYEF